MALKSYGHIVYHKQKDEWLIVEAEPHVCIKLKALFTKISTTAILPFKVFNTLENSCDLLWFMDRYPMDISKDDLAILKRQKKKFEKDSERLEGILFPEYKPSEITLNGSETARDYQLRAADFHQVTKRYLLADDLGLGKTLSGILTFLKPGTLPGIVVVQTHLPTQWKAEVERFTGLKVHKIKVTKPYDLPKADVYIFKYTQLAGWMSYFRKGGFFKSVIFDEAQELRRSESSKYEAAKALSKSVEFCLGMTATPIYGHGSEIFNIMDLIKPMCLGYKDDFLREWAVLKGNHYVVQNPNALGTHLRDQFLFLRRTKKEVGRELPPINKIIHTVGYDEGEVKKAEDIARQLSMKVFNAPTFMERGKAALELDILLRHKTGVSKAREVAEYVKILLDNNEPVLLAGWHREVYDIWLEEFKDYKPVMYTGSETASQKEKAKEAFLNGETNLFIISLRSGVGLDGLQKRCKTVVIGELDWAPGVHDQLIGRINRDGQGNQITAIYLVSDFGSDPVMVDYLALKSSQAEGIINPLGTVTVQVSDESRLKMLAETFLRKRAA